MPAPIDDIEGLPTEPAELRAWVAKLRSLFRLWADVRADGEPEKAFKRAGELMTEIRAMLGMPTAEQEIAAARAADIEKAATEAGILGRTATVTKEAGRVYTAGEIKASMQGAGLGDGSDKNGKFGVRFYKSDLVVGITATVTQWRKQGVPQVTAWFLGEQRFDTLEAMTAALNSEGK